MRPARPAPQHTAPDSPLKANVEFAWRVHTAQENWTSKVDTKASVFFTVNLAGLAAVLAFRTQKDGLLATLTGWRHGFADLGILLCGIAVVVAGVAIFPLLGPVREHQTRRDAIYFGHLRHRSPTNLAQQLVSLTEREQIEQVSRQLVVMAKGNWTKHRCLQLALLTALVGYGSLFAIIMSR